jgi:hypothetical protein
MLGNQYLPSLLKLLGRLPQFSLWVASRSILMRLYGRHCMSGFFRVPTRCGVPPCLPNLGEAYPTHLTVESTSVQAGKYVSVS